MLQIMFSTSLELTLLVASSGVEMLSKLNDIRFRTIKNSDICKTMSMNLPNFSGRSLPRTLLT